MMSRCGMMHQHVVILSFSILYVFYTHCHHLPIHVALLLFACHCSLAQPDTVRTLLEHMLNGPIGVDERPSAQRFPNVCCEILNFGMWDEKWWRWRG